MLWLEERKIEYVLGFSVLVDVPWGCRGGGFSVLVDVLGTTVVDIMICICINYEPVLGDVLRGAVVSDLLPMQRENTQNSLSAAPNSYIFALGCTVFGSHSTQISTLCTPPFEQNNG